MLITNATLVTWENPNRILPDHGLWINGSRITELGPSAQLRALHPLEEEIDARGQLVMPGNICAHTHFYGAFSRGMAIPGAAPADFPEILQKLWWPLDRSLTDEDVRYSALLCLVDAVRSGTTTLFDHHASPNAIEGSLDLIAEAVEQAGLRAALCYEVTDRDGPGKMRAGLKENMRWTQKLRAVKDPLLAGMFGLHASLTLSDSTLDLCRDTIPEGSGFHIHVAESDADQQDAITKSKCRVVERLYRHGILGPSTIAAHCVQVDAHEMDLLAETNTWVSHQPRSNMNNGVGVSPVEEILGRKIRVCLGNDGFSNAMWDEWMCAYLVHKVHKGDPRRMNGNTVLEMAIYHNAALASHFFPAAPVGSIQIGAVADLIFVDYFPPTPLSPENLPWHILFGFRTQMVTTTIAGGRVLMKDRELLTLDEKAITAKAKELAEKVWARYESQF